MYRTDTSAGFETTASTTSTVRSLPAARPSRYRARDFGLGYGSSSGYASARRYAPGSQQAPRFSFR